MPVTWGKATNYQKLLTTQQNEKKEMSLWISESLGLSPDATSNLGPWSCHAAWGRTVTTNNATIPAMLTVHKMSAMICFHCAHHLPVPVWSPWPTYMLRFPHALCLTYTHNHPTPHYYDPHHTQSLLCLPYPRYLLCHFYLPYPHSAYPSCEAQPAL